MLSRPLDPLLVAVVEDDPSCRTATDRLLHAEGFQTALFPSAEAYISAPPAAPICLILDVHLPGMSGIELQQRLTGCEGAPPIIMTTGTRDVSIRERAVTTGCAAFLWKPFDADQLFASIAACTKGQ